MAKIGTSCWTYVEAVIYHKLRVTWQKVTLYNLYSKRLVFIKTNVLCLVNGTGWHQAGGDKASAAALLVNSIRNSPTQQLVGTSLANQLSAINHQSLSSSPVLQQLTTQQQQQQLTTQQQQQVQAAQQQQQQYGAGIRLVKLLTLPLLFTWL